MYFEIIFPGVDVRAAGIRTREREGMTAAVSSVPTIRIQLTIGLAADRTHDIAYCIINRFKACMNINKSKTVKKEENNNKN